MKSKYIYMAVTRDKYELPITIADTAEELGRAKIDNKDQRIDGNLQTDPDKGQ